MTPVTYAPLTHDAGNQYDTVSLAFKSTIQDVEWPLGDAPWTADETRRTATAVGDACRHAGYFFLNNHGVPADLIAAAFDETHRFYSRPPDQKARFNCSAQSQFLGYRGLGAEKSRMHSGAEACEQYRIGNTVATPALAGLVEFYHEPFRQGTRLFEELVKVGSRLMSLCPTDLGLGNTFDGFRREAPMHRFGLNYYKVGAGQAMRQRSALLRHHMSNMRYLRF